MKLTRMLTGLALSAVVAGSLSALSLQEPKVEFTGYKTPDMAATNGGFKNVTFALKNGANLQAALNDASATLNPKDIDMGDGAITKNIVEVFFKNLNNKNPLKAKVLAVTGNDEKGVISVRVTIEKNSEVVPLVYEVKDGVLTAKGQLDLLGFGNAKKALKALSDAAAGHQGVSWPLVDLVFSAKVVK